LVRTLRATTFDRLGRPIASRWISCAASSALSIEGGKHAKGTFALAGAGGSNVPEKGRKYAGVGRLLAVREGRPLAPSRTLGSRRLAATTFGRWFGFLAASMTRARSSGATLGRPDRAFDAVPVAIATSLLAMTFARAKPPYRGRPFRCTGPTSFDCAAGP
jgi:hypothetical protein